MLQMPCSLKSQCVRARETEGSKMLVYFPPSVVVVVVCFFVLFCFNFSFSLYMRTVEAESLLLVILTKPEMHFSY